MTASVPPHDRDALDHRIAQHLAAGLCGRFGPRTPQRQARPKTTIFDIQRRAEDAATIAKARSQGCPWLKPKAAHRIIRVMRGQRLSSFYLGRAADAPPTPVT